MSIFFTSDQHYGHRNICKYAGRPFNSVEEMDEALIENHNSVVGQPDQVWFLGDFAFAHPEKIKKYLRRLNGQKNLVLGNHDGEIRKRRKEYIGSGLLNSIYDYREFKHNGQHIVMFHYGCRVWNRAHHGSWLLYGHSHGSLPPQGKSVDVGVDDKSITSEYRPLSFEEIKGFMDKRSHKTVDHHG